MEAEEGGQDKNAYDSTIFAFNVVLTSIVTSLGIIGNGLVLILLRHYRSCPGILSMIKVSVNVQITTNETAIQLKNTA